MPGHIFDSHAMDRTGSSPSSKTYIVGLGASAGGIRALRTFFQHVDPHSGAAFVVILHLSPDHDSRLAEVLQVSSSMAVTQVKEDTRIEPDHVYVIPPNKGLDIHDSTLVVTEVTRMEQRRAPVDVFFRALADTLGADAVCVVLSGTGPNGSAGLKRVKEYGGLAMAQDPAEAEFSDMPNNSIATGLVDFVLPAAAMPERIRAYHQRRRQLELAAGDAGEPPDEREAIRDVLTALRLRTGHDFSNYKAGTLRRRIERRIHLQNLPSLVAYARVIQERPDEAVALMKDLLISVTNFFRDPQAFEALEARIIPRLFAGKSGRDQVRVWIAGCATGEEAYSIAMLLAERAAITLDAPAVQVFATDLDAEALAVARDGFYTDAEIADVSDPRVSRFFQREAGGYRVRRELRELLLFAHHNLIKDPPFSHLDLISCRNVLIYLNRSVQDRVIETFHFALRPGAFLFLGGAESPDGASTDLFVAADKGARIYEGRSVTGRMPLPLPGPAPGQGGRLGPLVPPRDRLSPGELHQRLLERYGPPSVVVTEDHRVLHMSETAGRFLHIAGGEPTRDILRIVRPDLRADLRTALHRAKREKVDVEVCGIAVSLEDGVHRIDLGVRPVLGESDPARGYMLITFRASTPPEPADGAAPPHRPSDAQLANDVARLKLQLRDNVEQHEFQAETAQAANEELQAMNEELRSAAEELETSKEELQSVNEELTTVNQELKIKIEELGLTNNDFQNLINSSDIGTIFLDRELRVKLSSPTARQIFNLQRTDVGRPLADFTSRLLYDGLHGDAEHVLDRLQTIDREVQTRDGQWHSMRLRPYRTTDDRIVGVVITFQDITDRRRAEIEARRSEERMRLIIDSVVDYAIVSMSDDGRLDSWNPGAERIFGYVAEEVIGKSFAMLFTPEDRAAGVPEAELERARRNGRASDERLHTRKDGTTFYCSGITSRIGEEDSAVGFVKIARDMSTSRSAAESLREAEAQLDAVVRERTGELEAEVHQVTAAQVNIRGLLRRVVTAQEEERARIARNLHDQLGQQLTALRLALEHHKAQLAADGRLPGEVEHALELTRQLDKEVDFLTWELRPAVLDDLGLAAALPLFVQEWSRHHGVAAEYRAHGFSSGQLTREAELVFYRVTQESLNNAMKHAHASRVDVMLEQRNGEVILVVEDDGIGFDPAETHSRERGVGLAGMRERAAAIGAHLEVESSPGEGTSIYLRCAVCESAGSGT